MNTNPTLRGILIGGSLTGLAWLIAAGPLTPPAGIVSSTAKPLAEVEPRTAINLTNTPGDTDSIYRITAAGSYYLTGNITGVTGKKGIEVVGSGITIDLMGFTIAGAATPSDGISIDTIATQGTVTIRNGTIASCRTGINQLNNYGNLVLEGVDVRSCTLGGAIVNGGEVRDCRFVSNTGAGLHLIDRVIVEHCLSKDNTSDGFVSDIGGVTFRACIADGNDADGFDIFGAVMDDCQALGNSFTGFNRPAVITNSYASGGTVGLSLSGSVALGCSIDAVTGSGITMTSRSRLTNCRVAAAAQHGVLVSGNSCTIEHCSVGSSGTSLGQWGGIKVDGTDNVITDNQVSGMTSGGDDTGIWVTTAGNVIIRNAVTGASDLYNIVASNAAGPEINSASVATTTSPTANIGY